VPQATPPAPAPAPGARGRAPAPAETASGGVGDTLKQWLFGTSRRQGAVEAMAKSTMRTVGNRLGQAIVRGVLGGISGGRGR
jgi:hypothetical protein